MSSVDEQVIDFYYELFDRIFTQPFRPKIKERLRQDAVARQVQEAAGAASQALTRFFLSQQLSETQVAQILQGFSSLYDLITLEDIASSNYTPESLVDNLLKKHSCPASVDQVGAGPIYRVALHQTVQVLMLVGPVMSEWQRLSFSSTYEMPRRIVTQLNQITEGLKAFASAGQAAADDLYELAYRDHLLQRFYRVEAGTVRMTTNLYIDLRELFVMPHIQVRPKKKLAKTENELNADVFMNLSDARAVFGKIQDNSTPNEKDSSVTALEQVKRSKRNIIVGLPGGGKSTLFEWLQLSVANVEEELIAGDRQAIPLLLRVRQLDPKKLPYGADLIEKATASRDRATLMPPGWIDRQMEAGRVIFMLDGLDETEPGIRDKYILPWLTDLCDKYPECHYLLSSRPVGYRSGSLRKLNFAECDLVDFSEAEIAEYTRHWCTAIRLAQNDPDDEARREGAKEGEEIVTSFKSHPYISNLARNPLMLSAICLVNYFEGGELPKDRAILYRLCVEGLLHHWDQRRGIRSEYSLNEKLRVCREVAVAMQKDDRAEYEASKVLAIFIDVLKNKDRAKKLLEHIRYRTGLLIERRAGVFAFAHLTFQEYLAARAIYEGNNLKIDAHRLAQEHSDGRWNEVIAIYCGLASPKAAQEMIKLLLDEQSTIALAEVLSEAFLSSTSELTQNRSLRRQVLERIAVCPGRYVSLGLDRFALAEVAPIANARIGTARTDLGLSESYFWLLGHHNKTKWPQLVRRLKQWRELTPMQTSELVFLIHLRSDDTVVAEVAKDGEMYKARGPKFASGPSSDTQAVVALLGLTKGTRGEPIGEGVQTALLQVLRVITRRRTLPANSSLGLRKLFTFKRPADVSTWPEYISLARKLAAQLSPQELDAITLIDWADQLETEMDTKLKRKAKSRPTKTRIRVSAPKPTKKKPTKRSRKR
jgi:NACHT domain-containing protein